MKPEEVAELAGVRMVTVADGRRVADDLRQRVQTAADRMEAAEVMAGSMADGATVAALGALCKADPGAWSALLAGLRAVRGMSAEVRALERLVDRATAPVRLAGPREAMDAPDGVPDGWRTPDNWHMSEAGIWLILPGKDGVEETVRVTTAPLWVTGRLVDVDSQAHSLELAWRAWDGGGLVRSIVDAATAADARSVIRLADQGAPVHSANARDVVRYLAAAAAANVEILPVRRTAARMGWMPGGFMLGETWIGDPERPVTLTGDDGLSQIARGYRPAGTWEGWCGIFASVRDRPSAVLAVWASVASVLLEVCGAADNMIVEWAGRTSQGKSTVQRLGASVWGKPARVTRSWKGKAAGHEAYMASLRNLPPVLDDSKKAHSREVVTEVVYMHSGGQGANRGAPGSKGRGVGQRAVEEWRSLLLSSGEQRCTSAGEHAGAAARALVFWGSPLASGDAAKAVGLGCEEHHGHVGPRVLRWLLDPAHQRQVRAFVAEQERTHAQALEAHSDVAGRLATVVAYLEAAGQVCLEVGVPAPSCDVIAACYAAAREGGEQADRPAAALLAVYDRAMAQPARLWHRGRTDEPTQGWIGVMLPASWKWIALRPQWVAEQLDATGHDREVVDEWRARGWIQPDSDGKPSIPTGAWLGTRPKMLRILRSAVEAVGVQFEGEAAPWGEGDPG